jgi:hypothetical protein
VRKVNPGISMGQSFSISGPVFNPKKVSGRNLYQKTDPAPLLRRALIAPTKTWDLGWGLKTAILRGKSLDY